MAAKPSTARILMLHGYTQSGPFFEIKTRRLCERVRETLCIQAGFGYEDVEFIFATAPHRLKGASYSSETNVEDAFGWWTNLDDTSEYVGLEDSLELLADLCFKHGPFAGVVGFSMGGALSLMFASWCESGFVNGRAEALEKSAARNPPRLASILRGGPPQGPLDFAICFSGFRGTMEYYGGFYDPPIETPILNVVGKFDTFIPREGSRRVVRVCQNTILLEHPGTHYVPTDPTNLTRVIDNLIHLVLDVRTPGRTTPINNNHPHHPLQNLQPTNEKVPIETWLAKDEFALFFDPDQTVYSSMVYSLVGSTVTGRCEPRDRKGPVIRSRRRKEYGLVRETGIMVR